MPPARTLTRGRDFGGPSPLAGRGPLPPPAVLSEAALLYLSGWIRRPASLITAGRVRFLWDRVRSQQLWQSQTNACAGCQAPRTWAQFGMEDQLTPSEPAMHNTDKLPAWTSVLRLSKLNLTGYILFQSHA